MSGMTQREVETMLFALQARCMEMQRQLDTHDVTLGAHTEGINYLRGDKQRVEAQERADNPRSNGPREPAPVAQAGRKRMQADADLRARRGEAVEG